MARTAVVAGTATAVAGGVSRRQEGRAQAAAAGQAADQAALESQAELAELKEQLAAAQAQQGAVGSGPGAGEDMLARLSQLAELRQAGVLTDEEFSAAKAKLLG